MIASTEGRTLIREDDSKLGAATKAFCWVRRCPPGAVAANLEYIDALHRWRIEGHNSWVGCLHLASDIGPGDWQKALEKAEEFIVRCGYILEGR